MSKKPGPYLRQPRPGKVTKKVPDHFIRQWRQYPTAEFPKGMTLEVLAERADVSLSSISAYENGADPSFSAARRIAAALNITVGMLTDIDPTAEPTLWSAYLRATEDQRELLDRMAVSLIQPAQKKRS